MNRCRYFARMLQSVRSPLTHEPFGERFLLCAASAVNQTDNSQRGFGSEYGSGAQALKRGAALLGPGENVDLSDYRAPESPSFNFAAYANKSPLLQKFIDLGVELHKLEESAEVRQFIVTLKLEKDVEPVLNFFCENGVPTEKLGEVITRHPLIFKEDVEDLKARINYLLSKKFTGDMIANIIVRNPQWLSTPVRVVDARLGFLQQTLQLTGDQIRKIVSQVPSLGTVRKETLMVNVFTLKEEMDIEQHLLRHLIVNMPSLLTTNAKDMIKTYDYLIMTMKVPQHVILRQPKVLKCRTFLLSKRHKFLERLGRAQYQPTMPGYISPQDLALFTDEEFCSQLAKAPISLYNDFLKTR